MIIRNIVLVLVSLGVFQTAFADVQVTLKEEDGGQAVTKLTREWGKVASASMPGQYLLLNMKNSESYLIDTQNRQAIKMDGMGDMPPAMFKGQQGQRKPDIKLIKKGSGPSVAGYATIRYQLKADGELCSEHFISKGPLKFEEIRRFSETMSKQFSPPEGMAMFAAPCEMAEQEFDKMSADYGVPLLSKMPNGLETFRILEIKSNVSFSEKEFKLPAGYRVVSQREMMQQEMQRAMAGNPDGAFDSSDMPSEEEMRRMGEQMEKGLRQMEQMMDQMAEQ